MKTQTWLTLAILAGLAPCTITTASDFYDPSVLTTLELQFDQTDWWAQLEANYDSQENILATLTVEDVNYEDVGVRFRGNTSYRVTQNSEKAPFNIEIDYVHEDQRLDGYKTLNLINCMQDPTFMREVLYSNTCRRQIPSAKANFIKLVINGENWGIYANVQQINVDFIKDWFPSNDGTRWRAEGGGTGGAGAGNRGGGFRGPPQGGGATGGTQGGGVKDGSAALTWLGEDSSLYEAVYELKNTKLDDPWTGLIQACDILNNSPLEELTSTLDSVLNVDRALWLCAFEVIFHDDDGYVHKRGSDYALYFEPENQRLHLMQYDGNSCMRSNGEQWSLFYREDDPVVPIMNRLLSIPQYRQRYLAHVRTILNTYLTEDNLYPTIDAYQSLIEEEVGLDTKKLYTTQDFIEGVPELKDFILERQSALLQDPEVNVSTPVIASITHDVQQAESGQSLIITVEVTDAVTVAVAQLYLADTSTGPFSSVVMEQQTDKTFAITSAVYPAGTALRYYLEVTAADDAGTITYSPAGAEHDVYTFTVTDVAVEGASVVINEVMAKNEATIADPQGDYDDWIELYNRSDATVDLSGMYLSDNPENPLKWQFPAGTSLPAGTFLIVWADEDGEDEEGLHANFKLAAEGETIWLYDTDGRDNVLLDSVVFEALEEDQSIGRTPDGEGILQILTNPSPGESNND